MRKDLPRCAKNDIIRFFRGMKKSAALLLVILSANFCSLFKSKVAPYPSGVIFPVVKDQEISYEGEIISLIQKVGSFLYFSTQKGKVYCIDGEKKEIFWQFDAANPLACPPYVAESRIFVHDKGNNIYCLGQDGKLQWKTALADKITSSIAEDGDQVYCGTEKGQLHCLSAETGQEIWQYEADSAVISNLVIWHDDVLFGGDDNIIRIVDHSGRLSRKIDVGARTGKTLALEESLLFFGTEDRYLHCVDLNRQKTKWKIRSGGATFVHPVISGNQVLFLCWNCVLYCLNKKNGSILWWGSVPSRSYYRIEVIEKRVVASSFSPEIVCFDLKTGESVGTYEASQELKSNPAWFPPFLLVNLHEPESDKGKLVFLKKDVGVNLISSKKSPQKPNEEITFSAKATGFHLPKYEFFLSRFIKAKLQPGIIAFFREGDREIVQQSSELSAWDWFPGEQGYYNVEVEVLDEREKAHGEMPYSIQKEEVDVSLLSSLSSPQNSGKKIVFTANFSGFETPQCEFRVRRLKWVSVHSAFFLLFGEDEEVVQGKSAENSWIWTPGNEGLYLIKAVVQDEQEMASDQVVFAINKE
jgi:hypothetical protein